MLSPPQLDFNFVLEHKLKTGLEERTPGSMPLGLRSRMWRHILFPHSRKWELQWHKHIAPLHCFTREYSWRAVDIKSKFSQGFQHKSAEQNPVSPIWVTSSNKPKLGLSQASACGDISWGLEEFGVFECCLVVGTRLQSCPTTSSQVTNKSNSFSSPLWAVAGTVWKTVVLGLFDERPYLVVRCQTMHGYKQILYR